MAPLGRPVVPEEYKMAAISSPPRLVVAKSGLWSRASRGKLPSPAAPRVRTAVRMPELAASASSSVRRWGWQTTAAGAASDRK